MADTTNLIILIGLLGLIKHTGSQGPGFHTPKDCQRLPFQGPGSTVRPQFQLVCDLRTINSEFDRTNFSVIPALATHSLTIQCAESIPTQSRLLNGSLEHLTELEELSFLYCNIPSVPAGSFSGLTGVKNLSINTYPEEEDEASLTLTSGSLAVLPNLERLDLSHSDVWRLPEAELCNLAALTHLNLSYNSISDVSDLGSTFCQLSVLLMDLAFNQLRTIHTGDLSFVPNLRALDLAHNSIAQVHDGALKGLDSLRSLDLSGNQIVALPGSLFQDTPQLQQLKLDNNRLSVISARVLSPLTELVVLDLSSNLLTTPCLSCPEPPCTTCLTERSFLGLTKLVILNLAGNRIQHLHATMFKDLGNLQILDLSSNLLEVIPASSFSGLRNLHTLKLSDNGLTTLEAGSLQGILSLNTLNLQNNSLGSLEAGVFNNLTLLQDLNLFANNLGEVPTAIAGLRALKTVDLGKNGIEDISDAPGLRALSGLIGLKLDENRITTLTPSSLANLTSLKILNLAANKIEVIEKKSFDDNANLQAVRLDSNQISDIVGVFNRDLRHLQWLNISDNRIEKFDYFLLPPSLNWLDIHSNQIEDIGNYFDKEAELNIHTLDFSFNKLKTINAKNIPDKIQVLSLNDNLITRVDPLTFVSKKKLVRVDLYANQLAKLDTNAVRLPGTADVDEQAGRPEFYLGGNPFMCDCNLEWLKSINQLEGSGVSYPLVRDLESIYCKLIYSQDNNAYIPLVEAQPTDFLCYYKTHCFALCHCCDFDACDCEMTCPDNCTCYHDQSWSTNIVDCAASQITEPPTTIPMDATDVYLHGNNFKNLSSHSFIGRKKLRVLYLNHSNIEAVLNYTFYGLRRLERLHLEHNNIHTLEGHEFQTLRGLKSLYLDHNRISWIEVDTFSHLVSLETLRLDNNQLFSFGFSLLTHNPFLIEISLANNPWSCECDKVTRFNSWLEENKARVTDVSQVACFPNNSDAVGRYILDSLDCSVTDTITLRRAGFFLNEYLPLIIVLCSVLTVVTVSIGNHQFGT